MSESVAVPDAGCATLTDVSRVQDFGPAPLDEPDAYPGVWPSGPVVVDGAAVVPLGDVAGAMLQGRIPFVAYGADACPAHIARTALHGPIVLTPTVLRNHLVVYAGHLNAYGALPATVARWPGASTQVFIAWLTEQQQDRTHRSDVSQADDRIMLPTSDGLVAAHRPRTGFTLASRKLPVRVAGISCEGQSLPPAMTQAEVRLHRRAVAG